jgi:hypothetical protein
MSGIHITIGPAYARPAQNLQQLFQKPLIVGASVSADYFTESPGKLVALDYTSSDHIKVLAKNGKPSTHILSQVTESLVKDRTIIVGVDLFLWDSFTPSAAQTLEQMDRLIHLSEKYKIPVVLGEIPTLLPGTQKSAAIINRKLYEHCQSKVDCYVLPLHDLMVKTLTDGYIDHQGRRYDLQTLVPDGLHIARPASQFLAEQIKNLLR